MRKGKKIALYICTAVLFVSLGCLGMHYLSQYLDELDYEKLAADTHVISVTIVPSSTATPCAPSPIPDKSAATSSVLTTEVCTPSAAPSPTPAVVLERYAAAYAENSDLVAWLSIDDTTIDYPVVRIEGDNDFYLHHNFYKNQSGLGTPFVDYRCMLWPRSTNLIIYGHHIRGGKMFSALLKYENDPAYCAAHSIIHFNTIYEEQDYQVMAVFRSQIYRSDEDVFKFYNFIEAKNAAAFDSFEENILALSQYDTCVSASFGDSFITLVTCAYHVTNGRFVIVAKRID